MDSSQYHYYGAGDGQGYPHQRSTQAPYDPQQYPSVAPPLPPPSLMPTNAGLPLPPPPPPPPPQSYNQSYSQPYPYTNSPPQPVAPTTYGFNSYQPAPSQLSIPPGPFPPAQASSPPNVGVKSKKIKTATRIARETARKLRHRERRRIGRRQRRNQKATEEGGGNDAEGGSASEPKTPATESVKAETSERAEEKAKSFGASSGEESMDESSDEYEPDPAAVNVGRTAEPLALHPDNIESPSRNMVKTNGRKYRKSVSSDFSEEGQILSNENSEREDGEEEGGDSNKINNKNNSKFNFSTTSTTTSSLVSAAPNISSTNDNSTNNSNLNENNNDNNYYYNQNTNDNNNNNSNSNSSNNNSNGGHKPSHSSHGSYDAGNQINHHNSAPSTPTSNYSPRPAGQDSLQTFSPSYSPPPETPTNMSDNRPDQRHYRDERDVYRFRGQAGDDRDRDREGDWERDRDRDRDRERNRGNDRENFTFSRPGNVAFGGDSYRPSNREPPREPASFRRDRHDERGTMRYDRDRRDGRRDGHYREGDRRRNGDRAFESRPWVPPPAHDRPILRLSTREKTPEQFPAMVAAVAAAAEAEAKIVEETADDMAMELETPTEENIISLSDEVEQPPTKRVKTAQDDSEKPVADTAKPPETEEKKMDIIAMIRSAKAAIPQKRIVSANNDDFISFDDDSFGKKNTDDDSKRSDRFNRDERKDDRFSKAVPTGPAFSHRDFHHGNQRPPLPPPPPPESPRSRPPPPPPPPAPQNSMVSAPGTEGAMDLPLGPPPGLSLKDAHAGRKRSFSEVQFSNLDTDGIKPEYIGDGTIKSTPWLKLPPHGHEKSLYMGVWLHKEILDFYDYIRPQTYEHLVRENLVERIRKCIVRHYPDAVLYSFGSFASQMYLPKSDMDLVLCSSSFISGGAPKFHALKYLHNVASYIAAAGISKEYSIAKVTKARVPLVKFVDKITGINVDISFENLGGVIAIDTFKQWKEIYPDMPKIALILKQFLAVRGLNEPYTGGLGSFSLICLVVSLLQVLPEASSGNWDSSEKLSLGRLLMEFLLLYGKRFNTTEVGIKVSEPGYFQKTLQPGFYQPNRPFLLSIMDPNNPDNDISKSSYRVQEVFDTFSHAYDGLENTMTKVQRMSFSEREGKSLLGCILSGNYDHIESQRKVMQNAYLQLKLGTKEDLNKCIGNFYDINIAAVPLTVPLTSPTAAKGSAKGAKGAFPKKKKPKRDAPGGASAAGGGGGGGGGASSGRGKGGKAINKNGQHHKRFKPKGFK